MVNIILCIDRTCMCDALRHVLAQATVVCIPFSKLGCTNKAIDHSAQRALLTAHRHYAGESAAGHSVSQSLPDKPTPTSQPSPSRQPIPQCVPLAACSRSWPMWGKSLHSTRLLDYTEQWLSCICIICSLL